MLGFHVTIMDDREDFVTKERFPEADQLVYGDFKELAQSLGRDRVKNKEHGGPER